MIDETRFILIVQYQENIVSFTIEYHSRKNRVDVFLENIYQEKKMKREITFFTPPHRIQMSVWITSCWITKLTVIQTILL